MKALKSIFITLSIILIFACVAHSETFVQSYYKNNPLTVESLENTWGKPVAVKLISNGAEMRIYGEKDAVTGYTYFVVKSGKVVDRGVTPSLGNGKVEKKFEAPELSGWMPDFYKKTNRTVKQILKKIGSKPVYTSTYPNGMKRMVFGPIEQDMYAYVIVMNGRVVDVGPTEKPHAKKNSHEPNISPFMKKWYKDHPKTTATLYNKWGKPLSVVTYRNGLKKMTFGPKDSETGYNFFIIKDGKVIDRGFSQSKS